MPTEYPFILDDDSESKHNNKRWIARAFLLCVGTIVYLFLAEYFKDYLSTFSSTFGPIEVRFSTISFLLVLFVNAMYTPYFLSRIQPDLSNLKVACFSGGLYCAAILIKVFSYNYFIYGLLFDMNFPYILYTSGTIGLIGVCASNIRIRKLRGLKTGYAWLLLFIVWIAFYVISIM